MSLLSFEAHHRYSSGFRLKACFETEELVTALCGPSGSGKTTVLEMIAGLQKPDWARIQVAGRTVTDTGRGMHLPPEERRIGFVFQDRRLFPHLTVARNLRFGKTHSHRSRNGVEFEHLVEILDLGHLLERFPRNLSGGEQQRVTLGRALLIEPRFLLLDEPLVALDRALRDRISEYIARIVAEYHVPTLIVSHTPDHVTHLATRTVWLDEGRCLSKS